MSTADELTAGLHAELDRLNARLAEPLLDLRQEAWKKIGEPAQQEPICNLYGTLPVFDKPAQQDIPDLIAGALGVSRGTAYDLMREALAEQQAQQEPVAWNDEQLQMLNFLYGAGDFDGVWFDQKHPTEKGAFWWRKHLRRLFDTPQAQPAREWVGLADEDIEQGYETTGHYQTLRPQDRFAVFALARAIEAKLKEKNT